MYVWTVTHGVVYFNLVIGNLPLFYGCHSISLTGITSSYDIMYLFFVTMIIEMLSYGQAHAVNTGCLRFWSY